MRVRVHSNSLLSAYFFLQNKGKLEQPLSFAILKLIPNVNQKQITYLLHYRNFRLYIEMHYVIDMPF